MSCVRHRITALLVLACLAGADALRAEDDHAEVSEYPITAADRDHWSFRPLERPQPPEVADSGWSANPIDRFVLAKLQQKDIRPQPPADRETLIRRLTIDLTGLPPTPAEIDAFLADRSPLAYQRLVDRLLASPAYGERWAQFWLDLARWAETDGFEHDKLRPDVWRYRDWVIDALNDDLPYDEFVALQLAGDQLRPGDPQARTATGFCLAGPDMPDINLKSERQAMVLNELTGTVGAVLLGLQMGCAQCHDHMYDPISQLDFYRLGAVFAPAVDLRGHTFNQGGGKPEPSYLLLRGDFRRPGPEVRPAAPRIADRWQTTLGGSADGDKSPGRRAEFARWLTRPDHPLTSRVLVNRLWQQHFGRGLSSTPSDFGVMGDPPQHPELLDWLATELVARRWSMKEMHRLIVCSATYRQASRPTGDAAAWTAAVEHDPANLYWSRFPRRRLTGETIRDLMLAAGGHLNQRQHGQSVRPPLPAEVVQTLLRPDHWQVDDNEADHYRRSIYVFARRNLRYPMFEAFDRPAATATCAARQRSTTAPQSLLMLNSEFSLASAQRLAGRVMQQADDPAVQVAHCYRLTLGRMPSDEERRAALAFLDSQQQQLAAAAADDQMGEPALPIPLDNEADRPAAAALVGFALALFNSSEFVYLE